MNTSQDGTIYAIYAPWLRFARIRNPDMFACGVRGALRAETVTSSCSGMLQRDRGQGTHKVTNSTGLFWLFGR